MNERGESEEVVFEGMLTKKWNEGGQGSWTPDNKPEENQWFWKDFAAMAGWASREGREVQPVFVDVLDGESLHRYKLSS